MTSGALEAAGICATRAGAPRGPLGRSTTVAVLHDISLSVPRGRCTGLVGRSGSGKTSLLRVLLAVDDPTAGQVLLDGVRIQPGRAGRLRAFRRAVQHVPQDPRGSLDPRRTVRSSLAFPLRRLHVAGDHDRLIGEALDSVGLHHSMLDRRPDRLSGGEAQRVTVARALATGARLLLVDEPVSGLDPPLRDQVLDLFGDVSSQQGVGVLFVSHDLGAVARLCGTTAVMADGRIVEHGPTETLLRRPAHPATAALVGAIPRLPHTIPAL